MATDIPDLAVVLSRLLAERGLSKRGFAKMLAELDGSQSWSSWLTSVKRYTRHHDPVTPTEEKAQLMESALRVPAGTLVRQTRREQLEQRVRSLEAENQQLRALLEKRMHGEPGSESG